LDVLVLENLDDLVGKKGTQQELLFTISALIEKGAHIVVSSTQSPIDLKAQLEAQLFSRLLSGMTIFGIVGGRFAASPRVGVLLGLSIDFLIAAVK